MDMVINREKLNRGWTKVKFGEVVRLCTDRSSDPEAEGIERYVGLEHLEPEDLRIRSWGLVAEGTTFTNRFKPGQVLFGKRRAYQRKVAVADFEGVCSGDIYIFESADPKYLLPELLPFICQTDSFFEYAIGTSAGSLSPRTNWRDLQNFELYLPSREEQGLILLSLIRIEEAVKSQQELLNKINDLRLSIAAQVSLVAIGSIRFVQDPYVKPGWQLKSLDKLCSHIVDCLHRTPNYIDEGIPAIRTTDVQDGELKLAEVKRVSQKEYATQTSRLEPLPGDILYSREAPMGHAVLVPDDIKVCISQRMMHFRCESDINSRFVMEVLNSPFVRDQVERFATGTTVKHINVGDVKKLLIPIPDIELQNQFANQLLECREQLYSTRKRLKDSLLLKSRFLHRSIQGIG